MKMTESFIIFCNFSSISVVLSGLCCKWGRRRIRSPVAKLRDIAEVTGFSVATVSKALRGLPEVNVETRRRVLESAKKLGYETAVRQRRRPGTDPGRGVVGVVCNEITSAYYARIVDALEDRLHQKGYAMLLGSSHFDVDREIAIIQRSIDRKVSGLICVTNSERTQAHVRRIQAQQRIATVVVSQTTPTVGLDFVRINDELGAQLAAQHLVDLGHISIGYIGDVLADRRARWFAEAVKARGSVIAPDHVVIRNDRFEEAGYWGMKELLSRPTRPTAVLASYDAVAIGAMRALHEAGVAVPDDLSIMGANGIDVGRYLPVSLTTLAIPLVELASATIQLLTERMVAEKGQEFDRVLVDPEIRIGESTGPPSTTG